MTIMENTINMDNLRNIAAEMDAEVIKRLDEARFPQQMIEDMNNDKNSFLSLYNFLMKMEKNVYDLTKDQLKQYLEIQVNVLKENKDRLGNQGYLKMANELLQMKELFFHSITVKKYYTK